MPLYVWVKMWISALLRISPYLEDKKKKKLIYNTMIKSQFNYCPLVWMFCSRKSNNLVNKVQEYLIFSCIIWDYAKFNYLTWLKDWLTDLNAG